ncbi:MAG: cell division protein FtsQ/DivIB [Ignavibacteriaceae bacterium]
MNDTRGKILGTIFFFVLSLGILYLTFFVVGKTNKGGIGMIEITGNNLLSENDYISFSRLDDISRYEKLTLPVIKDRFEKHPYIERADVELKDYNRAKVVLTEKKIMAVVLSGTEPFFISENFQVLPLFASTKFVDLPVISNVAGGEKLKPLAEFKNNDMLQAFRIIDAARYTNVNINKKLSEINLRNGGDVLLSFSGVKAPVIFGRGEEAKKMVYLEIMWEGFIEGNNLLTEESDYIDLRFANEVYVGTAVTNGHPAGKANSNTGLN